MAAVREDARRVRTARGGDPAGTPAPITVPALTTAVLTLTAALTAVLLHAPGWAVAAGVTCGSTVAAVTFRRTLGDLAAGMTLKLARPYAVDEVVRIRAPEVAGPGRSVDAQVVHVGLVTTTLATWDEPPGVIVVGNTRMLGSRART